MNRQGFFISIEGQPGAGKTSLSKAIKKLLESAGIAEIVLIEGITGTPVGESLNRLLKGHEEISPVGFVMVEAAGRIQQVETIIRPGLLSGSVIIADSFSDTAYATHAAVGGNAWLIDGFTARIIGDCAPDISIHLDGESEKLLNRRKNTSKSDLANAQKMRDALLYQADQYSSQYRTIDALLTPEEVAATAWKYIKSALISRGFFIPDATEEASSPTPETPTKARTRAKTTKRKTNE